MEKDTVLKYLSLFLIVAAVSVLIYEVLPLLRSPITKQQIIDAIKIPCVLIIGSVVIKVMTPGEIPYLSDLFNQLNGLPVMLLGLSLIILAVYIKTEKENYFDVFKLIFSSFVGSFIQKNASKYQRDNK